MTAGRGTALSIDLQRLIGQIWPDPRLLVTATPSPDAVVLESYLAVPSLARARMLVPATSARVGAATLLAYNRLRVSARTRGARAAVAAMVRSGGGRLVGQRLYVCTEPGSAAAADPDLLLIDCLARALGRDGLVAAIGVSTADPNRKPTLQLFAADGTPAGYAKLGWSPTTAALVKNEAQALARLADIQVSGMSRPRLLAEGDSRWGRYLISEPLPTDVRAVDIDRWPEDIGLAQRFARCTRTWRGPLADSDYVAGAQTRVGSLSSSGVLTGEESRTLTQTLDSICGRAGSTPVELGQWHGDWSAWNAGVSDGQTWVWDWEHAGAGVPIGFDVVHGVFQRYFVWAGQLLPVAWARAAAELSDPLARLQDDPAAGPLIRDLYLIEVYLRAAEMAALGAGWNDRFRSPALAVLKDIGDDGRAR